MYEFRWNELDVEHIAEHGVSPAEAEYVVRAARRPFPEYRGDGKWYAAGRTSDGQYIQVIYVLTPADVDFVIHARPLTDTEKKRYRRRRR